MKRQGILLLRLKMYQTYFEMWRVKVCFLFFLDILWKVIEIKECVLHWLCHCSAVCTCMSNWCICATWIIFRGIWSILANLSFSVSFHVITDWLMMWLELTEPHCCSTHLFLCIMWFVFKLAVTFGCLPANSCSTDGERRSRRSERSGTGHLLFRPR